MPIISEIGRKDPKVRLLVLSIYVLLTLGAVTMVYPFMIMIAGSTKSAVDMKDFDPVPRYLYDDVLLYRKHMEGLFNESLDYLNIAFDGDVTSFEVLDPPESPNEHLVQAWKEFLDEADLLHFGGVMLAREPSRSACFEAVGWAREKSIPVSFDVNLRLHLWEDRLSELDECMRRALGLADIVKLGDGERRFLEGRGIRLDEFDLKLVAVTKGEEGSELICGDLRVEVPAEKVEAIDPTGAGDAYMAALLAGLYALGKLGDPRLSEDELKLLGRFANIVAGISTTRRGGWSVPRIATLEGREEIKPIVEKLKRP